MTTNVVAVMGYPSKPNESRFKNNKTSFTISKSIKNTKKEN